MARKGSERQNKITPQAPTTIFAMNSFLHKAQQTTNKLTALTKYQIYE